MIVSHKHKFIFLKTRKTASGACELALSRLCGSEDILKPDGDPDRNGIEYAKERNNRRKLPSLRGFVSSIVKDRRKHKLPDIGKAFDSSMTKIRSPHTEAGRAKDILGGDIWDSYYKFCFERNPFDRLVSFYHWRTKHFERKPSFKDFANVVIEGNPKKLKDFNAESFSNRPFYEINGKFSLNKVYKFENLESELQEIYEHLGLGWDGWLPHTKGHFRPKDKNYLEYYDKDLRVACERVFAYEMEMFGYEF
ncbi:MAG: sulfotransferase family 2 domain-containing protein [Patescibacteria group bacterium]